MEIICVGNELLIGKTLNTNATWLAKRVTSFGLSVKRITVVGDDSDEIASVLCEALSRRPRFVILTGGLGPTFDDKTLQGVAKGLKRKLDVNEEALRLVRGKYEALLKQGKIDKVELTPARVKMATFPKGAEALPNPVGTAPGMMLRLNGTCVIALPGVPPEMEAIFEGSLAPLLKKEAGKSAYLETSIFVDYLMESNLAPLIDKAMRDNPCVYIKSHVYVRSRVPVEGPKSHIELHFSTTAENSRTANSRLDKAVEQMSKLVRENGGTIKR
jgi:nicotinamide-nucleotide amidase